MVPVVHDVSGAQSVNLNVRAGNSQVHDDSNEDVSFRATNVGTTIWLQDSSTFGAMHCDRVTANSGTMYDLGVFTGVARQGSRAIN